MRSYTTFKIGGNAKYFLIARTKDDLISAVKFSREKKLPFFILGGGSNLLVSDEGFNGIIIKIENKKLKIKKSKIVAGAGVSLGKIVGVAARAGFSGMEWAVGIPAATIGGAVRGKAAAFDGSMAKRVESVEALESKSLKLQKFKNKDCQFSYRQSIFKKNKNLIIFSATLKLKKESKQKIEKRVAGHSNYRKARHPKDPSAGSIFKNIKFSKSLAKKFPEFLQFEKREEIPSAFLIERCGLKGKKSGGAKISEQHANFILNFNNAKAKDVQKLINLIKKSVKNKFGIILEEEIQHLDFKN